MKITQDFIPYINGEKFSVSLKLIIAEKQNDILYRFPFLENLVQNRRIIHLGCLDHIPLIGEKIEKDIWLHARLTRQAAHCLGVDIDREGVDYVTKQFGINNVVCGDITTGEIPEIGRSHWDYLVAGEILEHVDNPVAFLQSIKQQHHGRIERLIITVPNAFDIRNHKNALRHTEEINSDHRYYFTPFTLWKIIHLAGMTLESLEFVHGHRVSRKRYFFLHRKLSRFPALRDTIVAICRL